VLAEWEKEMKKPRKTIEIRDFEAAARRCGWKDAGPGSEIFHDEIKMRYHAWRQCCIGENIPVKVKRVKIGSVS
jgi:hypothetical protein